jgi:hypothetical protein
MKSVLDTSRRGPVTLLRLTRAARRNAMNLEMFAWNRPHCQEGASNDRLRFEADLKKGGYRRRFRPGERPRTPGDRARPGRAH